MLRRIPGLEVNQELRHSRRQKQECTYVLDPIRDFNTGSLLLSVPNSNHLLHLQLFFECPLEELNSVSWEVIRAHFLWNNLAWRFQTSCPWTPLLVTATAAALRSHRFAPQPSAWLTPHLTLFCCTRYITSPVPVPHPSICPTSDHMTPPSKPATPIPNSNPTFSPTLLPQNLIPPPFLYCPMGHTDSSATAPRSFNFHPAMAPGIRSTMVDWRLLQLLEFFCCTCSEMLVCLTSLH